MDDFNKLVYSLSKLPGVGRKSAVRMGYYLLDHKESAVEMFSNVIESIQNIKTCSVCGNYCSEDPCPICSDHQRDMSILCIIESQSELLAIEETGAYKGQYHILGGALDPLSGKGPDSLRINELLDRLANGHFTEVLIATNPTVEGESTFLYLQNILSEKGCRISRIATGIPMGGSLEYTDKFTLSKALASKHYL
ncbi:MAG: recombination protein RecR [Spirochaetales bacterium]|nr:recombination protein RecR [Spirochaetales bacterium]MBR6200177.1 recombination protein RecR [Spirochaetales bacterium]